jgi:phosphoadenosine phosphosulfate reductase
MTTQQTLPGIDLSLDAMVADAVKRLRQAQPRDGQPYYGCFSGGKDSCVIKELARLAGVNVVWHYNVTTIDPPELVRFIREKHSDVLWHRPSRGFFASLIAKGFPTRRNRWCCERLKENASPRGVRLLLGIRAEESPRRAKTWGVMTYHTKTQEYAICPICNWAEENVWAFINLHKLPYCSLYNEGWKRLGCIGCVMGTKANRSRDFARWPGYERCYRRAFRLLWERRHGDIAKNGLPWTGERYFQNWEELWQWWLNDEPLPTEKHECQGLIELFS